MWLSTTAHKQQVNLLNQVSAAAGDLQSVTNKPFLSWWRVWQMTVGFRCLKIHVKESMTSVNPLLLGVCLRQVLISSVVNWWMVKRGFSVQPRGSVYASWKCTLHLQWQTNKKWSTAPMYCFSSIRLNVCQSHLWMDDLSNPSLSSCSLTSKPSTWTTSSLNRMMFYFWFVL